MLILRNGDMFDYRHQALAQGVNCIGKMDNGIASRFRLRYPGMYEIYFAKCRDSLLKPGDIFFYHSDSYPKRPHVFNLVTQKNLKGARIDFLEQAVRKMLVESKERDITDIAMPEIGCGLGGLYAEDLKKILTSYFSASRTNITLYHRD
jgi:O-acetyl-ADP-ribose deacetylase (regulator of RNase III)